MYSAFQVGAGAQRTRTINGFVAKESQPNKTDGLVLPTTVVELPLDRLVVVTNYRGFSYYLLASTITWFRPEGALAS